MVDYATRYPEAQPLKDIHTETAAVAVNMFARVKGRQSVHFQCHEGRL